MNNAATIDRSSLTTIDAVRAALDAAAEVVILGYELSTWTVREGHAGILATTRDGERFYPVAGDAAWTVARSDVSGRPKHWTLFR